MKYVFVRFSTLVQGYFPCILPYCSEWPILVIPGGTSGREKTSVSPLWLQNRAHRCNDVIEKYWLNWRYWYFIASHWMHTFLQSTECKSFPASEHTEIRGHRCTRLYREYGYPNAHFNLFGNFVYNRQHDTGIFSLTSLDKVWPLKQTIGLTLIQIKPHCFLCQLSSYWPLSF